jgi:hypothetical protein
MEFEADMYGLNAAQQPDGEANVDLMLGEYRKLKSRPRRGGCLLRSSQRPHPHHGSHALESRAPGIRICGRDDKASL